MPLWNADERTRRIVAVASVTVAVLSLGYAGYRFFFPAPRSVTIEHEPMAYFYDLNTGVTFTAPADERGPVKRDSGSYNGHPAGVRAHVYACASCDDESRRFVAWVEIPIEALAAAQPEKYQRYLDRDESQGEVATTMIRRPDDEDWVPADSEQAMELFGQIDQSCPPAEGIYRCQPPGRPLQ